MNEFYYLNFHLSHMDGSLDEDMCGVRPSTERWLSPRFGTADCPQSLTSGVDVGLNGDLSRLDYLARSGVATLVAAGWGLLRPKSICWIASRVGVMHRMVDNTSPDMYWHMWGPLWTFIHELLSFGVSFIFFG
jgi:hypothetical protein